MKYVLLFALIQLVNIPLFLLGLPICAALAWASLEEPRVAGNRMIYVWPPPFWLWSNDEDGVWGPGRPHTRWQAFYWTALRNSVNNLRYVPGVSKPGRPLFYRMWFWKIGQRERQYYFKAGWAPHTGWPMISAGGGRGY